MKRLIDLNMKTIKKLEELCGDRGYISIYYVNSLYMVSVDLVSEGRNARVEVAGYTLKNAVDKAYKTIKMLF